VLQTLHSSVNVPRARSTLTRVSLSSPFLTTECSELTPVKRASHKQKHLVGKGITDMSPLLRSSRSKCLATSPRFQNPRMLYTTQHEYMCASPTASGLFPNVISEFNGVTILSWYLVAAEAKHTFHVRASRPFGGHLCLAWSTQIQGAQTDVRSTYSESLMWTRWRTIAVYPWAAEPKLWRCDAMRCVN
jgi:hypothetical protein